MFYIKIVIENLSQTLRPTVAALEEVLYKPIKLLDHGFIRVIDYMGDDSAIVQAARVSYGKGTKKVSQDRGLINYLMRNSHTTPFEMCEIKLHIKLPIFVARQWVRHRTANINEYSARYSILDKEFYLPAADQISCQSLSNKQGRGEVLDQADSKKVLDILRQDAERCYENYAYMLNIDESTGKIMDESRDSVARELARMNLTLNYYTQWYWKIDLHNLMHFLRLRSHSHAQYEIRVYAEKMLEILKLWVPYTYDAFMNYLSCSFTLSRDAINVVRNRLAGASVSKEESGLSAREWDELQEIFPTL